VSGAGTRPDCCQYCCHDCEQHLPGMDNCGISAQRTDRIGRPWAMRPLLRIRRFVCLPHPSWPPIHGRRDIAAEDTKIRTRSGVKTSSGFSSVLCGF
jgi:hypothetical protein